MHLICFYITKDGALEGAGTAPSNTFTVYYYSTAQRFLPCVSFVVQYFVLLPVQAGKMMELFIICYCLVLLN